MKIKTKAFAQITVDDDYIVRDNKPDVVRVIYTHGDILLEDTKVGNGNVWITGKLRFNTLYLSDDESHKLESVLGEIPFQEKLVMDGLMDGDDVAVEVQIEDLSVGIINSRKLMVRAVLNLSAKSMTEEEKILGYEIPADKNYEKKIKAMPSMMLVTEKKDMIRMQKELALPNSRSNIASILFSQVDFRNEEILLQQENALVQMDAQLVVIYRSETSGEYEYFETVVPLSGTVDLPQMNGDEVFWGKTTPIEIVVEPRGDYDGEARMIGLEVNMATEISVYREQVQEVLQDAYSLEHELQVTKAPMELSQLLVKNVSKVRLLEQVQLNPNQDKILQICGCSGQITIDRAINEIAVAGEKGVRVEGILTVHILYNTADDAMPFAHNVSQIPFEQFVEIDGLTEDSQVCLDAHIEQLQVNLLETAEYEVKAVIQIGVLAFDNIVVEQVTDIEEHPLNMELLQKQPGMIGCVRKDGEDLWDIAKRYHATIDDIIEIGDKVLVVKQVK